jgi:hypothetical protein
MIAPSENFADPFDPLQNLLEAPKPKDLNTLSKV